MVAVRSDCSLDRTAPIELSRQGAERVHWALQGGMSKLLIRAKAEGQPLPEPAQEQEAEVVDLMAALRESVEQTKKKRRATSKRKAS